MADVTEKQVLQLVKMLGLLGSDQIGERAVAALKVHEWVKSRGLSWKEVLLPPVPEAPPTVSVKGAQDETVALRADVVRLLAEARRLQAELEQAQRVIRAQEATGAKSPPQAPHNPHRPGFAQAQAAYQAHAGLAAMGSLTQPGWLPLAKDFLANHQGMLRGSKEQDFLQSQVQRGMLYGAHTRVSAAQEAWLRDILGRAGMAW